MCLFLDNSTLLWFYFKVFNLSVESKIKTSVQCYHYSHSDDDDVSGKDEDKTTIISNQNNINNDAMLDITSNT